jgi:hypothetical protein
MRSQSGVGARRRAVRSLLLLAVAACGGSPGPTGRPDAAAYGGDGGSDAGSDAQTLDDAGRPLARLLIEPSNAQLTLGLDALETLQFTARISSSGDSALGVKWTADHPELGTVDRDTGVFTPTGIAGSVTVFAVAGTLQSKTRLSINVAAQQQGDPDANSTPGGAGGLGGVGGDGGGTALADPQLLAALDAPATHDPALKWLYPYDGTVWPRGLPAPLLQWSSEVPARAVKIHIEVDDVFRYDGYFGAPKGLQAGQPIKRLPIPQKAWKIAQESGATLEITLTIAASDGAGGFTTRTAAVQRWTIAPTTLRGTVYYNSYGTKLAENYTGAIGGNGRFGGATLAIHRDSYDPVLVAGATTEDRSGCRVCHTVSADGSRMIAQQDDNMVSSAYDLRNLNKESTYAEADRGKFGWAALSPDGAIALGNAGPPGDNSSNVASLGTSALYRVSDGTQLPVAGLSELVTKAATPAFSVDGKKLAFNFAAGPGAQGIVGDGRQLVVVDFQENSADHYAISHPRAVFTASGDQRPGWPFFLPDSNGLVFQLELAPGANNERFATRLGARGELWWTDLNGNAHALDRANGKGYLPAAANGHNDDATLQYEPTVAPLVAGGYAWVVFTSRRMYGNVATRNPYESDARHHNLSASNANGPTTKKLWVAAIDIPAKPGSDPSHPAFYLPAQELYAGNSRGFWALDACKSNTEACGGGDECCGGYCRVTEEFTFPVCQDTPPALCAQEYDSCNVDADCCSDDAATSCIANRCARIQLN